MKEQYEGTVLSEQSAEQYHILQLPAEWAAGMCD